MLGQFVGQQESFSAPLARVRSLGGMSRPLVEDELVAGDEGLAAFTAVEGRYTGVQGHVVLESAGRLEPARALLALVDDRVTLDVVEPRLVVGINLATLVTNELLLLLVIIVIQRAILVFGQMPLQVLLIVERPRTLRALVGPVLPVFAQVGPLDVPQKLFVVIAKVFGTLVTNQLGLVNLQNVNSKGPLCSIRLGALVTHKGV